MVVVVPVRDDFGGAFSVGPKQLLTQPRELQTRMQEKYMSTWWGP